MTSQAQQQCHIPSKTFLKHYSTRPSINSYRTEQSGNTTRRAGTRRAPPVCEGRKSTASLSLSSSRLGSRAEHSGKALLPQAFTGHSLLPHMHEMGCHDSWGTGRQEAGTPKARRGQCAHGTHPVCTSSSRVTGRTHAPAPSWPSHVPSAQAAQKLLPAPRGP